MTDKIIQPSVSSLSSLPVDSSPGFGYNPAVGPSSNAITPETSNIILNKKTISLTPTSLNSIYDRNLNRKSAEINLSALSFLFCEIVSWAHRQSKGILDLELRLNGLGYQVGQRYLELIKVREGFKYGKRETKIVEMLQFLHLPMWIAMFGKAANELEKSQDSDSEYMITDNVPLVSQFFVVPKDYGNLNCSAFIAGIIEGALDSSFFSATVTAHSDPQDGFPLRTVFVIKFESLCIERESLRS